MRNVEVRCFSSDVELLKNTRLAEEAVDRVLKALPRGASNVPNAKVDRSEILGMRDHMNHQWAREVLKSSVLADRLFDIRSDVAEKHKAGNCCEQAFVAFRYLKTDKECASAEIAELINGDHVFVVIGEGKSAVACDPWASRVYPFVDFQQKIEDIHNTTPFGIWGKEWGAKPLDLRFLYHPAVFFHYGENGLTNVRDFLALDSGSGRRKTIMTHIYSRPAGLE